MSLGPNMSDLMMKELPALPSQDCTLPIAFRPTMHDLFITTPADQRTELLTRGTEARSERTRPPSPQQVSPVSPLSFPPSSLPWSSTSDSTPTAGHIKLESPTRTSVPRLESSTRTSVPIALDTSHTDLPEPRASIVGKRKPSQISSPSHRNTPLRQISSTSDTEGEERNSSSDSLRSPTYSSDSVRSPTYASFRFPDSGSGSEERLASASARGSNNNLTRHDSATSTSTISSATTISSNSKHRISARNALNFLTNASSSQHRVRSHSVRSDTGSRERLKISSPTAAYFDPTAPGCVKFQSWPCSSSNSAFEPGRASPLPPSTRPPTRSSGPCFSDTTRSQSTSSDSDERTCVSTCTSTASSRPSSSTFTHTSTCTSNYNYSYNLPAGQRTSLRLVTDTTTEAGQALELGQEPEIELKSHWSDDSDEEEDEKERSTPRLPWRSKPASSHSAGPKRPKYLLKSRFSDWLYPSS